MTYQLPQIGWPQLALSGLLVLIAGLVAAALRLGLIRGLVWGAVRSFLQLTLIGYALAYVFSVDHPLLVAALVAAMCAFAARVAVQRLESVPFRPYAIASLSLGASTFIVGSLVCGVIIHADRWYTSRVAIPIAGMILGNSLNGVSLALERFFSEVRSRAGQVEQRLSLGYTPWEAVRPQLRAALRAGMIPTINALMVVGVVSLPGMMTGQILAGADPRLAVRYQIVVMLMIAAAVAIGCLVLVGLCYRRAFTAEQALIDELTESADGGPR